MMDPRAYFRDYSQPLGLDEQKKAPRRVMRRTRKILFSATKIPGTECRLFRLHEPWAEAAARNRLGPE